MRASLCVSSSSFAGLSRRSVPGPARGFLVKHPASDVDVLEGDAEVDELKKFPNVLIYLGFAIVSTIVLSRIVDYF